MPFTTALTERLGIRHPILLAPMGAVSGGALAAAVTRAGGLGLIGPGYADEAWIDREFDAAGNTQVGIGFITWHLARHPERLAAALARKPAAVMLSFGDAAPFAPSIRGAGAALIMQVQSPDEAADAAALGADVIVAQGSEAGGHGVTTRALFALLPAVIDRVAPVPVAAAGGVADGRGLAAALAMGAAGVLVGTRFFAARESLGHDNAKARIVAANGGDTLRTQVFDIVRGIDWPRQYTGRAIANDFTRRWHGREHELTRSYATENVRYATAAAAADVATAMVLAGEGVDLIDSVKPAGEIVERMVAHAEAALGRIQVRR